MIFFKKFKNIIVLPREEPPVTLAPEEVEEVPEKKKVRRREKATS